MAEKGVKDVVYREVGKRREHDYMDVGGRSNAGVIAEEQKL